MLEFFQQKQKNKKSARPGKKGSSTQKSKTLDKSAIFPAILLSIKALFNLLFVLGFLGGMLGVGIALGYGVALLHTTNQYITNCIKETPFLMQEGHVLKRRRASS